MRKWTTMVLALLTAQSLVLSAFGGDAASAAGSMTKYRVYQNDKALREFSTENQAIAYAQGFEYSHVETITGRGWVWDNFPRYKIYQGGNSNAKWEYRSYEQALAAAKSMNYVHIRDLEKPGWIYQSYAKYQLYQGDNTYANWGFTTIAAAKKEAGKWTNSHIIELSSNQWVWDNVSDAQEKKLRAGSAVYQIEVDGAKAENTKNYAYLFDAIKASVNVANSVVMNTKTNKTVHSNVAGYTVQQSGKPIKAFVSLEKAIQYANYYSNSEIVYKGSVWWTNAAYLSVYQGDKKLKSFHSRESAVSYARGYSNSYVQTAEGRKLWSNTKKLIYLGWNGTSGASTIMGHVADTQGLDIDSPSWFELTAANGLLSNRSDPAVVKSLREQGIKVMPLVHNQFDKKMTSEFLANADAQTTFINGLTSCLTDIGAYGVNLDFEEVAGTDRAAYTAFVKALAEAVHAKGMKISIDLPRGSTSWNHQTAYDHAALGDIVDTIIIMAYDQHWSGSDTPGPVAGLQWTEDGLSQFLSYGIPRSKLMLGIPFYVREWKLDGNGKLVGNRAIYMKEIPQLITDTGAIGTPDPDSGLMKFTYVKDGYTYLFWAETALTIQARIQIAKKYDIAGVAAWRLGYESSDLWTMMLRNK
ncbi:glycosyl hydrolase family 18 protein [Paenibacillus sp. NEAU-GSW1]|uniref:glycosyl hydrolase family 18 protein n=1 Tax=Paenibacillus sp. NEAU-GSW1 TaxID=2682486 RepID=UPI0012E12F6A|nr:glycosyl hydrolase family 18 protein [Paenibacillus sp. NEAU-GSW1]MUT65374.1 glycoside hydrolase [Paenibacillus sp. NEAU-GSW1]